MQSYCSRKVSRLEPGIGIIFLRLFKKHSVTFSFLLAPLLNRTFSGTFRWLHVIRV